jgi:hypothetical protein
MSNKFRNQLMRQQYDLAVQMFKTKHRNLFWNGERRGTNGISYGSSVAESFWKGFDGLKIGRGYTDKASRETLGYAYYRAGEDCAKVEHD